MTKTITAVLLASGLAATALSAQADEGFGVLEGIDAAGMSAAELDTVKGKAHVYSALVARGVTLGSDRAVAATMAAAPNPKSGKFMRSPSREAAAFVNLLGP